MSTETALTSLPIAESIPAIKSALASGTALVLQAPPGSGKSTIVPLTLLNEPWLAQKKILMLQPRRVAARAIAARMADLLGEPLGETVGYQVRFESKVSARTRIEVVTEGILTRRIQADPELSEIGLVIFDEFHERSLHADLALAFALDAQSTLRPDLRLLIMSATIDSDAVAGLLGGAPIVTGKGVPFPVTLSYLPQDPARDLIEVAARSVVRLLRSEPGDLLLFLPGVAEIKRVAELIAKELTGSEADILELYGELPFDQQKRVLAQKSGKRRVILSTPIAETSLTIEGVRLVVDSGFAKSGRFDLNTGANRIVTERISADSAEQRAGRAGRVSAGLCLRLWSEHTQRTLRKNRAAEIVESDLAPFMLELAAWGAESPEKLRFLDYPPPAAVSQARSVLQGLSAVGSDGKITPEGRALLSFGAHPRIAHMLLSARKLGLQPLACDLAALLDGRDIFDRDDSHGVDVQLRADALLTSRRKKGGRLQLVEARAAEWARRVGCELRRAEAREGEVGLLLAFAYPERIARRRTSERGEVRYLLSGGWGAKLPAHDSLQKYELLVVAHMQVGAGDGNVYLAAPVMEQQIRDHFSDQITSEDIVEWDSALKSVRAEVVQRLGAVVLHRRTNEKVSDEERERLLIEGLRAEGVSTIFRWDDEALQLRARIETARRSTAGLQLPDCSDVALDQRIDRLLAGRLRGLSRLEHVREIPVVELLRAELDWNAQKKLDEVAPASLTLPNGKNRVVDYSGLEGPIFEATVQELLGWKETPKLAGGRISLLLHILSPARRPLQVTRDLASFWKNTYPEVRKEFRGRYPKHKWPENP